MKLVQIIILFKLFQSSYLQWIDPHSMEFDSRDYNWNKPPIIDSSDEITAVSSSGFCTRTQCDTHYKRILRLILENVYLENNGGDSYSGHLNVQFSNDEFKFLHRISGKENLDNDDFDEIRTILEIAVQKSSTERYFSSILSFQEQLYYTLFNETTTALFMAVVFLFVCIKMRKANFTFKSIIKYMVFLGYVIDFMVTYLHLLEAENINQMVVLKRHGNVPPECDPRKMSWNQLLKYHWNNLFSEPDCAEYYKVSLKNVRYLVTPFKVVVHQLDVLIVEPAKHIGAAYGAYLGAFHSKLPFGLGYVMTIGQILLTFIIVIMALIIFSNSTFEISVFPFSTLKIGGGAATQPRQISNQSHVSHRPLVEDLKDDTNQKSKKIKNIKTKSCSKCKDNHNKVAKCDEGDDKKVKELTKNINGDENESALVASG